MADSLEAKALALLEGNRKEVVLRGTRYSYTVPSQKSYPFQWFWDSCFHAIVYAKLGKVDYAKKEIRSLLAWQRNDGFIPHVIFWDQRKTRADPFTWHMWESAASLLRKPKTSAEIQPPVLAQALERIYQAERSLSFLREVLPAANGYYRWLLETRDPDHDSLITIIAPFESGLDFGPAFDPALGLHGPPSAKSLAWRARRTTFLNKLRFNHDNARVLREGPFHVEDVLVNTLLALNLEILADLNGTAGKTTEAVAFRAYARNVSNALIAKCWDKERGLFFNLSGRDEQRVPVVSIQSLMPLVIPRLSPEIVSRLVKEHLTNPQEFWTAYPVPSVAISEPSFSERSEVEGRPFLWRGTSWVNVNWYLARALQWRGYYAIARDLTAKTRAMIQKSGFREYFNPLTGEGYGAEGFGWSTLVVDM